MPGNANCQNYNWASPTLASYFVLSFIAQKIAKIGQLTHATRFNGVDYSTSLYGLCYGSCFGK